MIPAATYMARGCKPLLFTKSKGGADRVVVTLAITKGPEAGQQIDFRGMLTGGATPITLESLKTMGYDGDDDASVMKNEVQIVVDHETFDGKTYANIKYVNDPNRQVYTELTEAERAGARDRLRAAMAGLKATTAKPVAPEDEPKF